MIKKIFNILIIIFTLLYAALFYSTLPNINYIYISILVFVFIVDMSIYCYVNLIQKKRINEKKKYDYYRDYDFGGIGPIVSGVLLNKSKLGMNTIIIILYQLIDKKILDREYKNNNIYIKLDCNVSLDKINKLSLEEKRIVKYIFTGTSDTNCYSLDEIIDKFNNSLVGNAIFNETINYYKKEMKKYYVSSFFYIDNCVLYFCYVVIHFPVIVSFIIFFAGLMQYNYKGAAIAFIVNIFNYIALFLTGRNIIIKKKYIQDVNKLSGLYNYLSDFSNIDKKSLKYIEIYDDYYLYALSFGLTDKINSAFNENSSLLDNMNLNLKYLKYNNNK